MSEVKELVGKALSSIEVIRDVSNGEDKILFQCDDVTTYIMFHKQSCCESVTIDDICGDLRDLIDTPILEAREDTNNKNPEGIVKECQREFLWTFYNFQTAKGHVTIRWYGNSNGYYSVSVNFEKID